MQKIFCPFLVSAPLTQKFGVKYIYQGKELIHYGVDYALPKKTPLYAVFSGYVLMVDNGAVGIGYGKQLRIKGVDVIAQYAHLDSFTVKLGEYVHVGQLIGYSGRSGYSIGATGYHLHFGIEKDGSWLDPLPFLQDCQKDIMIIPEPSDKLIPLIRLYQPVDRDHFYTTSVKEAEEAIEKYGYQFESVVGHIFENQKI